MHTSAKILIVGGDGMIGSGLTRRFERDAVQVLTTSRRPAGNGIALDLSAPPERWDLPLNISLAYLCAGTTSIDDCRRDPISSRLINVEATTALARHLHSLGAHIVFISSNQVFDGTKPCRSASDLPCAVTEYGRQKAEIEQRLLAMNGRMSIVRLTKVLAPGRSRLAEWAALLREGTSIYPFRDLTMAPVTLDLALDVLVHVGQRRHEGISQVSANRDISYSDAAEHLAERIGVRRELVLPISGTQADTAAEPFPRFTSLDARKSLGKIGVEVPSPWIAIDAAAAC